MQKTVFVLTKSLDNSCPHHKRDVSDQFFPGLLVYNFKLPSMKDVNPVVFLTRKVLKFDNFSFASFQHEKCRETANENKELKLRNKNREL